MKHLLSSKSRELFWEFVKESHKGQVRKYTGEPYHEHLQNVAELACAYEYDLYTFEVAIGHDLLEDTEVTGPILGGRLSKFGYYKDEVDEIVNGIVHLSDHFTKESFPDMNRIMRKSHEARRLGAIPFYCQSIKYADLIDNTKSIVENDAKFARTYLREKRDVLNYMRKGNIDLLIKCCATIVQSEQKLGISV
jgi:(p)ppGpp synthase/HD superfamily hydrolase